MGFLERVADWLHQARRVMCSGLCVCALVFAAEPASPKSLAERLGYSPKDRLLILHADDIGMISSANEASFDAMNFGTVSSGSVMIPGPAAQEAIARAQRTPRREDFGVHLTLTSEWERHRWGPVRPAGDVPSLVGREGFFLQSLLSYFLWSDAGEVQAELGAQIEKAEAFGLSPTHLDSHMGAHFTKESSFRAYLSLARRFEIPPMFPRWSSHLKEQYGWAGQLLELSPLKGLVRRAEREGYVPIDYLIPSLEGETYTERRGDLIKNLRNLRPGVTQIIVHPTYKDERFEEQILEDHPGEITRHYEAGILQSPLVMGVLEKEGIHLVTWRQIQQVYPWGEITWP